MAQQLSETVESVAQKSQKTMRALSSSDLDLLAYMRKNNCLTFEFLNELLIFDVQLLDIKAFLSLLELNNKQVILFVGGAHAAALETLLQQANYTLTKKEGIDFNPLTDQFSIPVQLIGNQGAIATYIVTTDTLQRHPSGQLLKPLEPHVIHALCTGKEMSWSHRALACLAKLPQLVTAPFKRLAQFARLR